MRVQHTLRRIILAAVICSSSLALHAAPAFADDLSYLMDLQEMEDMFNKGHLLMVPHPLGVMPVDKDQYQRIRTLEILLEAKSPKDAVRQLAKLKSEIANLQRNGRQAIQEMIQETKNRMNGMDAVQATYRPSNKIDKPKAKPNHNGISAEELAESPPAPDAATRTLTVDSTPPPPPDDTPIVEASTAPPPRHADNGGDDDDAAIEAAQTFVGIAGALTRQNRPRGNNGNRGGGQTPSHPHPRGC